VDFLVAGLGFGALLVLAGYAVREFGVFLFAPGRVRKQFAEKEALAGAWRRICRFGSLVAMVAGVAIWLLLAIAVVLAVSDKTGAYLVATAATVASLAGAGAIYVAYRRFFSPAALLRHVDVTAVASGWNEPDVVANDDTEPVGGWQPRIIPKPTETFVEDMPAWGAVYEEPTAAAPDVEAPEPVVEPVLDVQPEPVESPETAAAAEESEPVVASSETAGEPEPDVMAADLAVPPAEHDEIKPESIAESEPPVAEPEPEPEVESLATEIVQTEPDVENALPPVDQVISEAPVAEGAAPQAPKRFKSALLSDIDEPASVDANTKYKSSILADLSAVRLPDDGPRYRSTALVDVAKPETDESEPESENGTTPRHG
jgi:uncharacterized membrane protein (UPF0136 family)